MPRFVWWTFLVIVIGVIGYSVMSHRRFRQLGGELPAGHSLRMVMAALPLVFLIIVQLAGVDRTLGRGALICGIVALVATVVLEVRARRAS